MDGNKFFNDFVENGFFKHSIKNEILKLKLKEIVNLWHSFRSQPLAHRETHIYDEQKGGYEYKKLGSVDYKENFHVSLMYDWGPNATPIDKIFIQKSKDFIILTYEVMSEILDIFDKTSQSRIKGMVLDSLTRWQLRFLYYPPTHSLETQDQNKFLAVPHVDKSLTTHWYESVRGFEILWNGEWIPLEAELDHILGYFGLSGQLYADCVIPGLCHRVVASPETIETGRTSIVMFHDFGNYLFDKQIWGSTNKVFPNGENYKMPIQEFSKYFIKI